MQTDALQSLTAAASQIAARDVSSEELTQQLLARIENLDSQFHSYRTVLADRALEQSRQADREIAAGRERGPLHGVPIAVKDLCYTKGLPTACGAKMLEGWRPEIDATVVERLEAAGAVILGKLHMTEFALRWHHPAWPAPVNPWGADLWPGVSSSGSGVATAVGLCFGSLGSDTGGSIRFPAASNSVVGLKPTYGRVSRYGVFPLSATLDNVGPITHSVADAAIMLRTIAGHDPHDPTTSRRPVPDYLAALDDGIAGLKIGVDETFVTEDVHPEVSAAVMQAIQLLQELGAELVSVSVPTVDDLNETWITLCSADALVGHTELYPARADEYGPFREWLEIGARRSAKDYAAAHITRMEFAGRLAGLFEAVDLIACPAMPTPTPRLDSQAQPLLDERYLRTRYTYPFNFSYSPTLTQPCGFTKENVPIALQLVGRHFEEELLLRAGHAFERATEWHTRLPPALL